MSDRCDSQFAVSPSDYSWKAWKRIVSRFKAEFAEERVTFTAASVAFYTVLGAVPLLSALVGMFGLFSSPEKATAIAVQLEGVIPPDALALIRGQLTELSSQKTSAGIHSLLSIPVALWGGSKAMDGLMAATNLAYREKEKRGFFRRKAIGIGLTAGTLFIVMAASALLFVAGSWTGLVETLLKWPLIFVLTALWMSVLYRYAPSRSSARWRWISHGAILASSLWILASFLFSLYASNFGRYNETYGSLGAIVVLLLWLYLSAIAIIVGARINAQIELETGRDTTVGQSQPKGERGAYVANNCAEN